MLELQSLFKKGFAAIVKDAGRSPVLRSVQCVFEADRLALSGKLAAATEARGDRLLGERFSRVDAGLFRGEVPTSDEDYRFLATELHVKTIVSLLDPTNPREVDLIAQEKEMAARHGLDLQFLSMPYQKAVPKASVEKFMALTKQASNDRAVYVHCRLGRDRTGTMVALHRMVRDGYSPQRALQEMARFGYDPQSDHLAYLGQYVLNFKPAA